MRKGKQQSQELNSGLCNLIIGLVPVERVLLCRCEKKSYVSRVLGPSSSCH